MQEATKDRTEQKAWSLAKYASSSVSAVDMVRVFLVIVYFHLFGWYCFKIFNSHNARCSAPQEEQIIKLTKFATR